MIGQMVLHQTTTFNRRCDLCHKIVKSVYLTKFDEVPYTFCSSQHLVQADKNFREKKEKNIVPTAPKSEDPFNDIMTASMEGEQNLI